MRNTKSQEKSIETIIPSRSMIEIAPDELRAVIGGRPTVTITVKPDGTIVIVQK